MERLEVAIVAANAAGNHMRENIGHEIQKTKSNKDDLVTVIDKQCQEIVFSSIRTKFPADAFLGEEDVLPGSEAASIALDGVVEDDKWLWIVDPIDGTTNFVHNRPASVVSIAGVYGKEIVVGVVYDPYRDEMFAALKGQGAFLNNSIKMTVSDESTFSEALIGFGIGTKDAVRLPMLRCIQEMSNNCRGLRLQGSAALELAWVAAGRQSGFFELDLNSWDIAAGALLVKEAGGLIIGSKGEEFSIRTRSLVATNSSPQIQAGMLSAIKKSNAAEPNDN